MGVRNSGPVIHAYVFQAPIPFNMSFRPIFREVQARVLIKLFIADLWHICNVK